MHAYDQMLYGEPLFCATVLSGGRCLCLSCLNIVMVMVFLFQEVFVFLKYILFVVNIHNC